MTGPLRWSIITIIDMRRSKTISLAEALKDYIKEMNFGPKLSEAGIVNSWDEVVGKAISSRTAKVYIKDKVLYVHLRSSVVRNELVMLRQALMEKLNEKAGTEVIRDIVFR
jgi:predicted nucleic acid-binding Zn ribbon protein